LETTALFEVVPIAISAALIAISIWKKTCREPQANPVPPQAVIVKRSATVLRKEEDDSNTARCASLDGLRPYRTAKRRWQVERRV
jgi:hypothetical protein